MAGGSADGRTRKQVNGSTMLCNFCGKKEAKVHLKEIIDNESRELHLCEACAREKGAAVGEELGMSACWPA